MSSQPTSISRWECVKGEYYLGGPLVIQRSVHKSYNTDKLKSKLKSWKALLLCRPNHPHQSHLVLPTYFMSTSLLPNSLPTELNNLSCNVWWGFDPGGRHLFLYPWSKVFNAKMVDSEFIGMVNKALV